MDINEVLDGSSGNAPGQSLVITGEVRSFLAETAKWAKFMAIVGFVMMGLGVLGMLFGLGNTMSMLAFSGMGGLGAIAIVIYLVFFVVAVMVLINLYRFATNMQLALQSDDQGYLRIAFQNLKSYFKIAGIITAIFVGFYVLIILFGLLMGIGSSF